MARLFQFNLLAFVLAVAAGFGSPDLAAQGCVITNSMTFGGQITMGVDIEGTDDPCAAAADGVDEYSVYSASGMIDLANASLSVTVDPAFTSMQGNSFEIVRAAGGLTGTFAEGNSVVGSDGVTYGIAYGNTSATLTRSPIFITDDVVGVCEGDNAIMVTLSNFPLLTTSANYNVGLVIEPAVGAPAGTASFAIVTVPAGQTTVTASFNEPGVGTQPDYEGGTIMINNVSPAGGGASLFVDAADVATIDVRELPTGTIALANATADGEICPGDIAEVQFTATTGTGPFTVVLTVDDAQATDQVITFNNVGLSQILSLQEGTRVVGSSDFLGDILSLELTSITDANGTPGLVTCSSSGVQMTLTGTVMDPVVDATDNEDPELVAGTCPPDVMICQGDAIPNYTAPTYTDNCTAVLDLTVVQSPAMLTSMNAGTTTVTFTATDLDGNTNMACTFDLTVTDDPDFIISSDAQDLNMSADCSSSAFNGQQYTVCSDEEFDVIIDTNGDAANTTYEITSITYSTLFTGATPAYAITANGEFDTQPTITASDSDLSFTGSFTNEAPSGTTANPQIVTITITGTVVDANNANTTCTTTQTICFALRPEISVTAISDAATIDGGDACDGTTLMDVTATLSSATAGGSSANYTFAVTNAGGSNVMINDGTGPATTVSGSTTVIDNNVAGANMANLGDFTFTNDGTAPADVTLTVVGVYTAQGTVTDANGMTTTTVFMNNCEGTATTYTFTVQPDVTFNGTVTVGNEAPVAVDQMTTTNSFTVCDGMDNLNATFDFDNSAAVTGALFNVDFNASVNLATPSDDDGLTLAQLNTFFTDADFSLTSTATDGSTQVVVTPFIDVNGNGVFDATTDCEETPIVFTVLIEAPIAATATPATQTICSGSTAAITVALSPTTSAPAGSPSYNYSALATPATVDVTGAEGTSVPNGTNISETLVNTGDEDVTVVFTIVPYTFGPNGVDDAGAGDDCVGTPVTANVIVEPVPSTNLTAADLAQTVCNDDASGLVFTTGVTPSADNIVEFEVIGITSSNPATTGTTMMVSTVTTNPTQIEAGTASTETFSNTGTTVETVTVEFQAAIANMDGTNERCVDATQNFTVVYTVSPTPMGNLSAASETICSGDSPVGTFTATTPSTFFTVVTTTDPGVTRTGTDPVNPVASGMQVSGESFTNTNTTPANVTFTVTPVSAGPNGDVNTPLNCTGAAQTFTVTVEPEIVTDPTAATITRCFDNGPINFTLQQIMGTASNLNNVDFVLTSFTLGGATVGTQTGNDPADAVTNMTRFPADGATLVPFDIVNTTTANTTSTFTFTPGFAGTNCTGDDFVLTVITEPEPTVVLNDVDNDGNPGIEEVCPGTVPVTTVDVTSPDGGRFLVSSVVDQGATGSAITGISTAPYLRMDGDEIETGTIENMGSRTGTVVYTIQPFSNGPNGVDDGGTGDDCLGTPVTYTIVVPAEPVLATNLDTDICSGAETGVILDETAVDNEVTYSTTEPLVFSTSPPAFTLATPMDPEIGGTGVISGTINGINGNNSPISIFADGNLLGSVSGTGLFGCGPQQFSFPVSSTLLADITADDEVVFTYSLGLPGTQGFFCANEIEVIFTYDVDDSFDVAATLPTGLTSVGFPSTGTMLPIDAIAMDTFRNETANDIDVVYTVTPRNGNCLGDPVDVTVTVRPEPAGADGTDAICSGEALDFDLNGQVSNTGGDLNGVTYTYEITRINGSVSEVSVGDTGSDMNGSLEEASLTNTSFTSPAVITYTVTPTGGNGCEGDPFDVVVTVNSKPFAGISNGGNSDICEGSSRTLTSLAFGGTPGYTYSFSITGADMTDGVTLTPASDPSATEVFVPIGFPRTTVTVTLTVTDAAGCSSEATTILDVRETPEFATGEPFDLDACEGTQGSGTAVFDLNNALDQTSGSVAFYTTFSDANAGVGGEITNAGSYSATDDEEIFVRLSNGNCFAVASFTLNVFPLPTVVLDPINDVCSDDAAITFTTNQTGGTTAFTIAPAAAQSAITDNGDGTASFNPAGIMPGAYTVTFTFTDGNTCANSASQIFNVLEAPTAAITTTDPTTTCAGDMVTLNASGSGTYSWSTGETTPSITVAPTTTTTYSVTVTSTNGCDDVATQTITVNPVPVVTITAPADGSEFCSTDGVVTLAGTTSAGTGVFTDASGATITEFDPGAGNGTFVITYTVTDGNGCTTVETSTVTVDDAPEAGEPMADFEATDDDIDYCLSTSPIDLATLLMGADQGGTFTIDSDPSGQAQIITNSTLDVSNVQTTAQQIEIVVRYTVDPIGNCPGDFALIYINFEAVPFAGTQPGLAYLCEDYGEFGLDILLQDATPGGTWSLVSNNVGITLIGDDMDSIDTRDVVFLFQGQTVPESRTVQFRYTVQPDSPNCDPDFVDAFLQINLAPTITRADADVVNDQICYSDNQIVLSGTVAGSASTGSWAVVDGDGLLTNQPAQFVNGDSLFTAFYTPAVSDRSDSVRFEFVTNDPDGPLQTNTLGFPFEAGPCEPERDTVAVLVFGEPVVFATPGNDTICNGTMPLTVLSDTTTPQPIFYNVSAVASDVRVVDFTPNQIRLVDGDVLEPNAITNLSRFPQTVTYTITPFDDGPDETPNTGDECIGLPLTVVVTVEPQPQISAFVTIDGELQGGIGTTLQPITSDTYEVCNGTTQKIRLDEFATTGTTPIYVRVVTNDPDGIFNGTPNTSTTFLPLAAAQALYGSFASPLINTTNDIAIGSLSFTSYIETDVMNAGLDMDECSSQEITVVFRVDPVPTVDGTVNGMAVDADANNDMTFVVCDEDDNVDFVITNSNSDPDSTLLQVMIEASNLQIVPGDPTPDNVSETLTVTNAGALLATINDWRLIDATTNGTATVTVVSSFDRNNSGTVDAEECFADTIRFTVDVNPTPVAVAVSNLIVCAGDMVPAQALGTNITSTTGTITYDYSVSGGAIGLADAMGATEVAAFTAVNTASIPVTSTVTVTPIFTQDGVSCAGDPITYDITVNPVPVVDGMVNGTAFSAAANPTTIQVCDTDDNVMFGAFNTNTAAGGTLLAIQTISTNVTGGVGNTIVLASGAQAAMNAADDYRLVDNTTNGTVQILITPFFDANSSGSIDPGECEGETAMIMIDVISTPAVADITDVACSDNAIGTLLPTMDANGLMLDNVTITSSAAAGLVGTPTSGTFSSGSIEMAIAADVFTNSTGGDLDVTYTVSPATVDCPGDNFTVTVTITSEPILSAMLDTTVCSDAPLGQTLEVAAGSSAANMFRIVDIVRSTNVTAAAGNTAAGDMVMADGIEDDSFNNVSTSAGTVTYEIVPVGACDGDAVVVTFTINPEPIVTTMDATVCSEDASGLMIMTDATAGAAVSYDITVDVPADLTPRSTNFADGNTSDLMAIANDAFNNVSGSDQLVVYSIVPLTADGCAGDTAEVTLTVGSQPDAPDATIFACSGEEFEFDIQEYLDDSGNGVGSSFEFTFENIGNFNLVNNEDGDINGTQTYVSGQTYTDAVINTTFFNAFTVTNRAVFTITPTATQAGQTCGGNSFTVTVVVNPRVEAASIDVGGSTDVCSGDSKVLQGSGSNGQAPYDYNWSIASMDQSVTMASVTERSANGGQIADFTATGFGEVVVEYFIVDANGCTSDPQQTTLTVLETPNPVTIAGPASVCAGSTSETFSVAPQAGITFNWSINQGGVIVQGQGTNEITVNFAAAAAGVTSTISVVAGSGDCAVSASLDVVTEEVNPDFEFEVNEETVTFTNTSLGTSALTYAWDFGDNTGTSTDANPVYTYMMDGVYEVCLTATAGGCSETTCQIVTVSECDVVALTNGLNLISTDVDPTINLFDTIFENLIATQDLGFIQTRGLNGQVLTYSPFFPSSLNQINGFEPGRGYFVFTSRGDNVEVCGTPLDPAIRPALIAGVNLVGYIPQASTTPQDFFDELLPSNLQLARGYEGGNFTLFNPFFPASLNTLTTIENGKGYEVSVANAVNAGEWLSPNGMPVSRDATLATSTYMVVAARTDLDESWVGREALVTDADGNVFAFMDVIEGGYLMTTPIYKNELNVTLEDGVELFVELGDKRVPMNVTWTGDQSVVLADVNFSLTSTQVTESDNLIDLTIAPNPFRDFTKVNISLEEAATVSITLTDVTGRTIVEVTKEQQLLSGDHAIQIDGRTLPSGTYFINVNVDGLPLFQEQIIRTH
ncbi:PKD-like domain-containing protein [Lewinella sp. 4G2]|uniref:PKD-like domain-containing protein n=1 Tax=Lewinella sp. 4G2 TaxID=1803372 RepID=UPI0007B4A39A|nr:PKD-like domain-containing protein [Lewinella sp. 4G2]OAV45407.1 hypothetical protein A3850_013290 [Lewinella sp. 4G2]